MQERSVVVAGDRVRVMCGKADLNAVVIGEKMGGGLNVSARQGYLDLAVLQQAQVPFAARRRRHTRRGSDNS